MADIASSDVTYTLVKKTIGESGYSNFVFTLAFGNGALTYPSGGVPLLASSLGCPRQILSLNIYSPNSGNGYEYKYDAANNKIRIYQAPAHPFTVTKGAILASSELGLSADAATATVNNNTIAATRTLTTNTPVNAAALSEVTSGSFAPAATTLYVEVCGW